MECPGWFLAELPGDDTPYRLNESQIHNAFRALPQPKERQDSPV